jgi:hypothetical protein
MVYILMFSIEIQIMNISALGLPKVLVLGIVSTTSMRRIQTLELFDLRKVLYAQTSCVFAV